MKILIVKLGAIGDIVHTLPALAAIRRTVPDAEISWVVERGSAEILRGNPFIDDLIEIDTRGLKGSKLLSQLLPGLKDQVLELRNRSFDIAVDFQGLLKSSIIAGLSGAKKRWGFSKTDMREPSGRIFLTDTVAIPEKTHVIRKNLLLVSAALQNHSMDERIEFPIASSDENIAEALGLIQPVQGDFALLNPAGGWVTKLWHAEKYGMLADRLWEENGLVSLVSTGPGESGLARRVIEGSRSGKVIGIEPSLKAFYEIARRAKIYVGGDTGPTHLAIAAGAPVVGIFGPTEWWRNGSLNPADICVERLDIGCRVDCHRRTCSKWICMDIGVETVHAAIMQRLMAEKRERTSEPI